MIEERREETARGRKELPETPHERANDRKDRRGEALQAPRRPDPEESAHQHRQVPSGERDEVALLHVLDASELRPPGTARVADMREAALHALGAQALKATALLSTSTPPPRPSAILIHLSLRFLRSAFAADNCELRVFQRAANPRLERTGRRTVHHGRAARAAGRSTAGR
jgi:hypothetical protein